MTDVTLTERARAGVDCGALLVFGFVALAILRPLQNAPFIDDATYAWSVEWLLQRGELRILDLSGSLNLTQVLWGWLFCLPGRILVFGATVFDVRARAKRVCALYLLLRELDVERRHALLGAGVLALNPVFFILQFTFMTDVAFVVLMVWTCFAAVRALRWKSDAWLLSALVLSSLAMGTRLVAVAIPVAISITLLLHAGACGRCRGRFLVPLLSLPLLVAAVWWRETWMYETVDVSQVYPLAYFATGKFTLWRLTAASNAAGSDGVYCNFARHCAAADQPREFSPKLVVANHRDLSRALSGPRRKPASRR